MSLGAIGTVTVCLVVGLTMACLFHLYIELIRTQHKALESSGEMLSHFTTTLRQLAENPDVPPHICELLFSIYDLASQHGNAKLILKFLREQKSREDQGQIEIKDEALHAAVRVMLEKDPTLAYKFGEAMYDAIYGLRVLEIAHEAENARALHNFFSLRVLQKRVKSENVAALSARPLSIPASFDIVKVLSSFGSGGRHGTPGLFAS